jgi:hypothetical protein
VWSNNIVYQANGAGAMPSSGYTVVNPLLARDATGTFHLQSGSPAIDAATGTYSAVTVDMDGQSRPAAKDIGADEVSTGPVVAQILTTAMVGHNGTDPSACLPVVASADDGNVPGNVLDNDLNTRWSASGDGQWIQFCLNSPTTVNGVQIAFYQGNTRTSSFDILTSTDGSTFTTRASNRVSSGTSLNLETFSITAVTAKYVRIVGHGNSASAWNSYTEVRIQTSSSLAREMTEEVNTTKEMLASYPNPFRDNNTIVFNMEQPGHVYLSVYDLTGKEVAVLVNGNLAAGSHRTTFEPRRLSAGIYTLKMVHNGKIITTKLVKQ